MSRKPYFYQTINGRKQPVHRHVMEEKLGRMLEPNEHVYHLNGDSKDNRIENLRIVCPNCNATLDTHCGKHLKKINNCVDCKTKIYNYAKRCQPCSVKYEKEKGELLKVQTRPPYSLIVSSIEELGYEKAGKKFGVCGMTIRRWKKEEGERLSAANKNRRERRRKLSSDRSIQGKS